MSRVSPGARRVGYGFAIGVQIVLLVVVFNILDWAWFSWLTDDFEQLIPLFTFAILLNVVVYLAWMFFDPPWFKSAGQIAIDLVAIVVMVRIIQVFPFDFSGYSDRWELVVYGLMGLGIFGTTISVVTEGVKLARGLGASTREEGSEGA